VQLLRQYASGGNRLKLDASSLSVEQIRTRLRGSTADLYKGETAAASGLINAAVLLPLALKDSEWHVLYIRRTETLSTHKGQVAFPGGRLDPHDQDETAAALRETFEEIGVQQEEVHLLGHLPQVTTPTGYLITPVVGQIPWPYPFVKSPREVSRIFTIPLAWLADSQNSQERTLKSMGRQVDGVVFFQAYDGELLWGITARITKNFLLIVGLLDDSPHS
jgi:8-oxo-dGTP pyrophosphatase MutT (NUDIX family)